jgi:hypothetical protein
VSAPHTGGCLCGGVRYRVDGPLRNVIACHCSQCRRTSGHFVAASSAALADLSFISDETLTWYVSSAEAKRGFCNRCGGNLFWQPTPAASTAPTISIMAGTLDTPTGLRTIRHIFVADKSDYYDIDDGVPASPQSD